MPEWLTRDHIAVVQAAHNFADAPEFARTLLANVDDPIASALEVVALLMTERVAGWAEVRS